MKTEQQVTLAIKQYADTVRRICFVHMKSYHDVEDIFQQVFLKYLISDKKFESDDHEKAWLIRVTINMCKDTLKSFFRKKVSSIEEMAVEPFHLEKEDKEILKQVLKLPSKYRSVIYLFYYEGYKADEIGKIMGKNRNTIYTWLSRGKEQLKDILGGENIE